MTLPGGAWSPMERIVARGEDPRVVRRIVEEIDDALEFNLPSIAEAEVEAWRQVHDLLTLINRFADEAHAPEAVWRDVATTLQRLHDALRAAVRRGRNRGAGRGTPPSK